MTPDQIAGLARILHEARREHDLMQQGRRLPQVTWLILPTEGRRTVINEVESYLANPDPSPADSPRDEWSRRFVNTIRWFFDERDAEKQR